MPRAVDKALEMIGEWRAAFRDDSAYENIHFIYSGLQLKGFIIPEVHLASASYMQEPPAVAEYQLPQEEEYHGQLQLAMTLSNLVQLFQHMFVSLQLLIKFPRSRIIKTSSKL